MKITATYKTCGQVSPDDFQSYTKVIHLKETDTLVQAFYKITKDWVSPIKQVDVELHFTIEE